MRVKTSLTYVGTALLSAVILFFVLQLSQADLNIPFGYEWRDLKTGKISDKDGSGDALSVCAGVKGMRENGWFFHIAGVGAPDGLDTSDWPSADSLHQLLLKTVSWVTPNFAATLNLFFLLGFPLTALTTLWSLKKLGISPGLAAVGSLMFAFLPYHFIHGEQHLFLSGYYLVAPTVLVALWVIAGEELLLITPYLLGTNRAFKARLTHNGAVALFVCALVGCAGIYYALFGVFLLGTAGLLRMARKRSLQPLIPVLATSGMILLFLFLNFLPHFIYTYQHGENPSAAPRWAFSAEHFALKISQLLLPVGQHRIGSFAYLSGFYARTAPLVNENSSASLGLLGGFGFLALIAWQLGFRWRSPSSRLLSDLASLNMTAVLVATLGGFGSLFAYTVSSQIRCYARMSIFIGFFALLALLLILEQLRQRWATSMARRLAFGAGMALLLFGALFDQTTPAFVPLYSENAAEWHNDERFVKQIEARVPADSMIFQLPYFSFPEGAPRGDYQLFRAYLHSDKLRWSYGAMRGRPSDVWAKETITGVNDINQVAANLRAAGFKGIYVDRKYFPGYEKNEAMMRIAIDPHPIESDNGRLSFYRL